MRRKWTLPAVCLLWASLIYLTSSTVVTPQAFFAWFGEHVFVTEESLRGFQLFWAAVWIFVVKGWHVAEFAILTRLTIAALDAVTGRRATRNAVVGGIAAALFAASDEWHQTFVPGRGGLVTDVLIDLIGVLGVVGACLCARRRRSPVPPSARETPVEGNPTR